MFFTFSFCRAKMRGSVQMRSRKNKREGKTMIATIINVILVLLGSGVGLAVGGRLPERISRTITAGLALCVAVIGVTNAIKTADMLCVILCLTVGGLIGEAVGIERYMDRAGDALKRLLTRGSGGGRMARFTEGFVTATLLFCVGSMAVMGSLEAGINHNYSIIISKGVIDGFTSITFAATMGIGVAFSVLPLLLYQGGITLLAGVAAPYLSDAAVTEMSAVGGVMLLGLAANMLGITKEHIRVGNMLPALFLPLVYLPLTAYLGQVFS